MALNTIKTSVADSQITAHGMKNKFINGNMDIWQRSYSYPTNSYAVSSPANGTYGADRWQIYFGLDGGAWAGAYSLSRQNMLGVDMNQFDVPCDFFLRYAVNGGIVGGGALAYHEIQQHIENVKQFSNKEIAISVWLKADIATQVRIDIDSNYGTAGSAIVSQTGTVQTISTSWQKFTQKFTVQDASAKTINAVDNRLSISFKFQQGANVHCSSNTIDIAQAQCEIGSKVTPFEPRNPGQEIVLCYRYYEKLIVNTAQMGGNAHTALSPVTTTLFHTTKRATPTVSIDAGATYQNVTSASCAPSTMISRIVFVATAPGNAGMLTGSISVDAEY